MAAMVVPTITGQLSNNPHRTRTAGLLQTSVLVANQNSQPGLTSSTVITAENPLAAFGGSYPAPTPFQSIGWSTPPQFKNAYSDQWTFGVQQKVSSAGVWTINYVGSRGRNLDYCPVANTATSPGPGAVSPRTPFPYMPQSFFDQPIGQLDYNALETSFQGRSRADRPDLPGFLHVVERAELRNRWMVWDWNHEHREPLQLQG